VLASIVFSDDDPALLMHRRVVMTQRDHERHRLLERRDVLVRHFHDVLECADHELDACELEDGMFKAAMWETYVLSRIGGELHELHDVIVALDRLERRTRATFGVMPTPQGRSNDQHA
jgi:hypothetical protein